MTIFLTQKQVMEKLNVTRPSCQNPRCSWTINGCPRMFFLRMGILFLDV